MSKNMTGADRRAQILDEAVAQAAKLGYMNVTAAGVAAVLDVQPSLVFHYFDDVAALRREVMRESIRRECLPVIAQGVALKDRQAMRAPLALRNKAVAKLQR